MTHLNVLDPLLLEHALEPRHNHPLGQVSVRGELHDPDHNLLPLLLDHISRPRHSGLLSVTNACATAEDAEREATVRITLQVEDERVTAAGFHASGDVVLSGCTSFLVDWVAGKPLQVARGIRPHMLTYFLQMPASRQWCAVMAIRCLLAALKDFERRRPSVSDEWQGSRHRNRHRADAGKDDADSQERFYIVGILTNLLLCLEVGHAAHHVHRDRTSKEREALLCDLASIRPMIPTLPGEIRQVISLVGLQGLTVRQAGEELDISHMTVNNRLWKAAQLIQTAWKAGNGASGARGT